MLIHVPRVLWTVTRGALLKQQPLAGLGNTHVYTARVNPLLDVDQFAHMNNASYAVHFEVSAVKSRVLHIRHERPHACAWPRGLHTLTILCNACASRWHGGRWPLPVG